MANPAVLAQSAAPRLRLGELLVRDGKLTPRDLDQALAAQREMGDLLGRVLVRLGLLSEIDVAQVLAGQLAVPLVLATEFPETAIEVPGLSPDYLIGHAVLPLRSADGQLHVAMTAPQDAFLTKALQLATGLVINPALALESELNIALARLYGQPEAGEDAADGDADEFFEGSLGGDSEFVEHLKDLASEAPVIRLVNQLIGRVIDLRASDIHLEPFEDGLHVRYRVDGVLQEAEVIPGQFSAAVSSRIKLLAHLNIAERRMP
ncbi:MAG: type II secretion system protein GspE, partial [Porticoccaceae bacterium]